MVVDHRVREAPDDLAPAQPRRNGAMHELVQPPAAEVVATGHPSFYDTVGVEQHAVAGLKAELVDLTGGLAEECGQPERWSRRRLERSNHTAVSDEHRR